MFLSKICFSINLGHLAIIFWPSFGKNWRGCQICFPHVHANNLRENFYFEKHVPFNPFFALSENVPAFSRKSLTALPKLISTCPCEHVEWKYFFCKPCSTFLLTLNEDLFYSFQTNFGNVKKPICFSIIFGVWAISFRPSVKKLPGGCQKWILRVKRRFSGKRVFIERNLSFFLCRIISKKKFAGWRKLFGAVDGTLFYVSIETLSGESVFFFWKNRIFFICGQWAKFFQNFFKKSLRWLSKLHQTCPLVFLV